MSEFMNRRGVNLVSTECLRLEWFFREQHESDQGVDAIVEKAPDEAGTGRNDSHTTPCVTGQDEHQHAPRGK
jgi:hypothetical protein